MQIIDAAQSRTMSSNVPIRNLDPNLIPANILTGKTIFGVTGTASSGKQFSNGTASVDGSSNLTVSGLTFQPSVIIIQKQASSPWGTSAGDVFYNGYVSTTSYSFYNGSSFQTNGSVSTNGGYVNSTGFKLFLPSGSGSYYWWAYQ